MRLLDDHSIANFLECPTGTFIRQYINKSVVTFSPSEVWPLSVVPLQSEAKQIDMGENTADEHKKHLLVVIVTQLTSYVRKGEFESLRRGCVQKVSSSIDSNFTDCLLVLL